MGRVREEHNGCRVNWALVVAFVATSFLCQCQFSYSANAVWNDDAGDGLWSSANNWDINTVPGATSDVQILAELRNVAGNLVVFTPDVEIDEDSTINTLKLAGWPGNNVAKLHHKDGAVLTTTSTLDVLIGNDPGQDAKCTLTNGELHAGGCLWIGSVGATGTFIQDGGLVKVKEGSRFVVGEHGDGIYQMNAGTLEASYG